MPLLRNVFLLLRCPWFNHFTEMRKLLLLSAIIDVDAKRDGGPEGGERERERHTHTHSLSLFIDSLLCLSYVKESN
jgi:hypothetical protein